MTGLMLPRHYRRDNPPANREEAIAGAISRSTVRRMDSDDFIGPKGVQDQLDMLTDYLISVREESPEYHLPKPVGWRLQVLVLTIPEKSDGGVMVVDESREQRSLASPQGVILSMGPACYRDPDRFTVDGEIVPWLGVGDRVQFIKYDAQLWQLGNGQRLGILTDTQPVAVIDKGWEIPE